MPLITGGSFGVFVNLAPLGAGGMGEVWRARDPRLEREVALKVLPSSAEADESARKLLLREARMASKLNHPNVCTIYEVGEAEDQTFIAMELVEGQSLTEKLGGGALPPEQVLRYGEQVAEALDHAHSRGVVHRDLKCANVVITPEGRAKVLDFGLAGRLRDDDLIEATTQSLGSEELSGKIAGTLPYMAPEQLRGQPADQRSDLWSLGVMLYEMASGKRPFRGGTAFELSSAILGQPAPPLQQTSVGEVSSQLQAVIDHCLEKDPDSRYQNSGEVRAALEMTRTGSQVQPPSAQPTTGSRRWPMAAAAVIAVLVAALVWLGSDRARDGLIGGGGDGRQPIRLAVLPFANLSGDPEQAYLSDGFTQEMITQLGKLHPAGLRVIARSSVMRYRGGNTPIDQIGRELDVDYVLEGSAQREGDRLRIATELIEVAAQSQLWADAFERELSGILMVQSEVAQEVAKALALELLPEELQRLASADRVNTAAYEAYLKGFMHWVSLDPAGLDTAERYFMQALEEDPSYAEAYAGLAWVWAGRQQSGISPPSEAGPKAKSAAKQAIALDETSDAAHAALAAITTWTDWDWEAAEREWQRTLEINPNNALAQAYYAHFLALKGRTNEAEEHSKRSIDLDPYNPLLRALYGVVLVIDRRFDEAAAAAHASLELQANMPFADNVLQHVYIAKGMREEQLEQQRERIAMDPGRVAAFEQGLAEGGYEGAQLAIADLLAERYELAKGIPDAGRRTVFLPIAIAWRYFDGGDFQRGIDWLEEAYQVGDPNLPYLGMPLFDPVRADPRFQDLAQRMELPHVTSVATSYQE
jgi:TolB-like protein/Tfp pilus assembly protein PilF/predicted Ser/Thr protein kinase